MLGQCKFKFITCIITIIPLFRHKILIFSLSFADLQARKLTSPAYEYSLTKEIPIADLKLSASAHRDHGAEICVGGFMFHQYTKYEEELRRRKATQVSQLSHPSSNNSSDGGDLQLYLGDDSEQSLFGSRVGSAGTAIERDDGDDD